MDAVLLALAAAAGAGALWWHQARSPQRRALAGGRKLLDSTFDADAEVALHVAGHEARQRGHVPSSLHVLYGLLQDAEIADALRDTGADPERVEDAVLAALSEADAPVPVDPHVVTEPAGDYELEQIYDHAYFSARSAERRVTCRDLWAYLAGTRAAELLASAGADRVAVLFRLCHRCTEPPVDTAGGAAVADVHVVLRNDDYTTRDFVVHVLERTFALGPSEAEARMLQTHTEGRGIVGRYAAAEAHAKIREVRARARAAGYPLWIATEPT